MGKIAFLFPGQGAQVTGMGKDFYDAVKVSKDVFDTSSKATGIDVASLCFEENENLNITEYTQVALLTTEVAILRAIEEKGYKPDYCAGLSLGEYGALAAANVCDDESLFKVIRKRGLYMQEAYPVGGAMMAVIGLNADVISETLAKVDGIVSIANDNCPGQIVITGEEKAVLAAGELLKEAGARRCLPLKVSGPFHSALLQGAGEKLSEVLKDVEINKPAVPYISNVTADLVTESDNIKELLTKQVSSPVRFRETILKLKELGVTTFVEIGPGKTLAGFIKKTDTELKAINVEKLEDLEKLSEIE
ncbi:MAG: ACP S-malonyltransferase [Lachnospiraceae bacterium]|nr:ACP S-malonyltransferase [Lachnospiraceae bacterium]